jgi:DNA-binding SARP family transcriptional activator/tetratricopeptide (TPR) repeat protein
MRFGILGPLQVDGSVTITAGRDRIVLAMLLLRACRTVPIDELMDAVWGEDPPVTARGQLQTCVSRLRRALTATGLPGDVIVTDPVGYGFRPDAVEVDAEVFTRLVGAGRTAVSAGRLPAAREHFRAALALWRGPALAGIPSAGVRRAATALDDQRTAVAEECVEVELRLGRDGELIDELTALVAQHPLRERLRGQLMRALCGVGRQADALAVYRDGRRALVHELGIEPGPELQELHQRVLAGELVGGSGTGQPAVLARCLPRDVADFTGRGEALGQLRRAVERADPTRPVVELIEGMAGSGKTALAVHLATTLAPRYPDAQLFVDLHGHSERDPLDPAAALVTLLRQLGVGSARIPAELEGRVGVWRTELAGRRALIVLDNAASAGQVSPLLPAGAGCLVLVTSRRRLVGLDGVQPYLLPVLDTDEAVELLARVAGPDRIRAEPAAAAEVVRRCGHLPLAIRLAGARLAHRPRWTVTDLVERLADDRAVLTELAAEDRTVAGAFTLSYVQLPARAQRLFRLLGLHPGTEFDARAAAALSGESLSVARDLLDQVVDGHLVEETMAGRFRFHDLMRQYAASLVSTDPQAERRAATEGLLDHLLHLTAGVTRPMEPLSTVVSFDPGKPLRPDLLPDPAESGPDWFEAERTTLVRAVRYAAAQDQDRYAFLLARAGWIFFYLRGYLDDLIDTHRQGIAAAERSGEEYMVALLRNFLASGLYRTGQWAAAVEELQLALRMHEAAGDLFDVARVRINLAGVLTALGQFEAAAECTRLGSVENRDDGGHWGSHILMAHTYINLQMGRLPTALALARRHLMVSRERGHTRQLTTAICNVGHIRARMGHHRPALRLLDAALRLIRRVGDRFAEAEVLHSMGLALRALGRGEEAVGMLHDALRTMQAFGDTQVLVDCRTELAWAVWDTGDQVSPISLQRQALASASKLRYPLGQARALDGLATYLAETDPEESRQHRLRALTIYQDLDRPEASEPRRPAEPGPPGPPEPPGPPGPSGAAGAAGAVGGGRAGPVTGIICGPARRAAGWST